MTTNLTGLEQEGNLSEKKKYPSDQYLNEILINLDFAANIPIEAVRVMARELLAYRKESKNPYGYAHKMLYETVGSSVLSNDHEAYCESSTHIPLYAAPPLQAVTLPNGKVITQHFDTISLETAKEIMCDVNRRHEFIGGEVQLLSRIQCRIDDACRAAMLNTNKL